MDNKYDGLPMGEAAREMRNGVALWAKTRWMDQEDPTQPFGFQFLGWSIEVHPSISLINPERPATKLTCSKVTHTGQLMEYVTVRI